MFENISKNVRGLVTAVSIGASTLSQPPTANASGNYSFMPSEKQARIVDLLENPRIGSHTEIIQVTQENIDELIDAFPELEGIVIGEQVAIEFLREQGSHETKMQAKKETK